MTAELSVTYAKAAQLLGQYCALIDIRDAAAWSELFTTDGRFELPDRAIIGRQELQEYAAASARGTHVSGLPVVRSASEGYAVTCSWLFHNMESNQVVSGYYLDVVHPDGDDLRFAVRTVRIHGRSTP